MGQVYNFAQDERNGHKFLTSRKVFCNVESALSVRPRSVDNTSSDSSLRDEVHSLAVVCLHGICVRSRDLLTSMTIIPSFLRVIEKSKEG